MKKMSSFAVHILIMNLFVDFIHILAISATLADVLDLHLRSWDDCWYMLPYCGIPALAVLAGLVVAMIVFCKNDDYCSAVFFVAPYVFEAIVLAVIVGMAFGSVGKALEGLVVGLISGVATCLVKSFLFVFITNWD